MHTPAAPALTPARGHMQILFGDVTRDTPAVVEPLGLFGLNVGFVLGRPLSLNFSFVRVDKEAVISFCAFTP